MLFSSVPFLYYFLPCVLLLYFLVPRQWKNVVLLAFSLVFYGWGEPVYVFLMAATILAGYICGLLMERFKKQKNLWLVVSLVILLGFLGYFKYADFFLSSFAAVTGLSIKLLGIALPIGISFYTFQLLSYLIDVWRGDVPAQKNILYLATYVTMFPQLIAGPIVRYSDVMHELRHRTHSFENAALGIRRFVLGLGKKILIANVLGELCQQFRAADEKSVLFYWLYALAFSLHIYFDFSGYSDMAIGLGRIFGFHFIENFNYPFISSTVSEFWRRWHMSLGSWFRDYVYIPLGGNRCSAGRNVLNLLVVWLLTGLWHGAAWTFVVWGLYFGVILMIEKRWLTPYLKKHKGIAHVYVILVTLINFVLFNAADMTQFAGDLAGMFGLAGVPLVTGQTLYYLRSYLVVLVVGIIGSTPVVKTALERLRRSEKADRVLNLLEPVFLLGLVVLMTAYLVDGSFNPFLYFRF